MKTLRYISIHAPHEGERRATEGSKPPLTGFQSTLPTRGSDDYKAEGGLKNNISIHAPHEGERQLGHQVCGGIKPYFNPRSPRGGATFLSPFSIFPFLISIHAPHEGERRI